MNDLRLDAPDTARLLAAAAQAHAGQGGPAPLLLDVREPWEVALGRIEVPGIQTLAVPMGQVPGAIELLRGAPSIVCYCHHGVRSLQVVAFLLREGLHAVYNLEGGIDAWSDLVDPQVPRY